MFDPQRAKEQAEKHGWTHPRAIARNRDREPFEVDVRHQVGDEFWCVNVSFSELRVGSLLDNLPDPAPEAVMTLDELAERGVVLFPSFDMSDGLRFLVWCAHDGYMGEGDVWGLATKAKRFETPSAAQVAATRAVRAMEAEAAPQQPQAAAAAQAGEAKP
jgi:hypothetical protein